MGSNKSALIFIALLLIIIAIAYPIFKKNQTLLDSGESGMAAGSSASTLLAKVQNIRLDTSILSDKNFLNLRDWTLPPLNLPIGKRNPFSPGF